MKQKGESRITTITGTFMPQNEKLCRTRRTKIFNYNDFKVYKTNATLFSHGEAKCSFMEEIFK